MANENEPLPQSDQPEPEKEKSAWQKKKESWYDHVTLSVHQLDVIIGVCIGGLVITFVLIALDALNIIG